MAAFADHITQAKHNLKFLSGVTRSPELSPFHDWQVTCCFYVGVHLVNAHLANHQIQYRTHAEVGNALNPERQLSPSKVSEPVYLAYKKLQLLSRRSRYLYSQEKPDQVAHTFKKHVGRAIRHLDTLLLFIKTTYGVEFETCRVDCSELQIQERLHFFERP